MPFQLVDLATRFPYLYHLTAVKNLTRIKTTRQLESAAELMRRAGRLDLLRVRRSESVEIQVDGETVILRDQARLHRGHIAFESGWDLPRLIELLNTRVFFWPGTEHGPIGHGQRHFGRYQSEGPAILRIPLRKMMATNGENTPLFCQYNSGSPRTVAAKKGARGSNTFLPCDVFPLRHYRVVEVTYTQVAKLPASSVQVSTSSGEWNEL